MAWPNLAASTTRTTSSGAGHCKSPYDKIGVQLDVLEAEQRTMESERLISAELAPQGDPCAYLETFRSNYASIIQRARRKLNNSNELQLPDVAEAFKLFTPAPSLFLSQYWKVSGAGRPLAVSPHIPSDSDVQSRSEMSPLQNRRPRKRRLVRASQRSSRRRHSSNYLDVPQLLRLGALSLPDLSVTGLNPRLSRWEAHGRHGHAANIMLRSIPVVVFTARHSPPAAWRDPDTLVSVTLSLKDPCQTATARGTFAAECSCKPSTVLFPFVSGEPTEADTDESETCEHVEIVLAAFRSDSGLTQLGVMLKGLLKQVGSTEEDDIIMLSCSNSGPQTAMAMSIAVSPILADIVMVVWDGKRSQGGAVPVLLTLSKRQNEPDVCMKISCYACIANARPDCAHEIACCSERDVIVKSYVAKERTRLRGSVQNLGVESGGKSLARDEARDEVGDEADTIDRSESDSTICAFGIAQGGEKNSRDDALAVEKRKMASIYGTPVPGKPYQSWARRPPLPCLADHRMIPIRAESVHSCSDVDASAGKGAQGARKGEKIARLVDDYGQCSNLSCRFTAHPMEHNDAPPRRVTLVQFDGAHKIEVRDWLCKKCGHLNRFEGLDSGTFSMTKTSVFCRRVLDIFVACTLRRCMTGRGAYEAFIDSQTASAEAYGGTGGNPALRNVGRREFSEAMSAFVSVLGDAPRR